MARVVDSFGEKEPGGAWKSADLPFSLAEVQAMLFKVDIMLEAISLNHSRGQDGKCLPGCWSCKVEESLKELSVAKKLGGV